MKITELSQNIDILRATLSPWQVWLFEKRRIIRQLDKVFDKEFNIRRLEEFKSLVVNRLDSKRSVIIENMRHMFKDSDDADETLQILHSSDTIDLIEGASFFWSQAFLPLWPLLKPSCSTAKRVPFTCCIESFLITLET